MQTVKRLNQISVYLVALLLIFNAVCFADQFRVTVVVDGDTLKAESGGYTITVRLVGIDAPETSKNKGQAGQPFSQKSKTHLMRLVLDKMVEVEVYGLDPYSRVVGVVYVDGKNVNLEMIKAGLAEVYRGPPAKGLFRKFRTTMHKVLFLNGKKVVRAHIAVNKRQIPSLKVAAAVGFIPDHWISRIMIRLPFYKSDVFVHHPIRDTDVDKFPLLLFNHDPRS